jgi:hypothetical protein
MSAEAQKFLTNKDFILNKKMSVGLKAAGALYTPVQLSQPIVQVMKEKVQYSKAFGPVVSNTKEYIPQNRLK